MNETAISQFILDTFPGVYTASDSGNTFFMYDPEGKFPFATLVTNDAYDSVSNLSRPGAFRLNIGVSKATFQGMFGTEDKAADDTSYDYAALDQFLPHPVYGRMYWVSILNPSRETFEARVRPLLSEAYEQDVKKHSKRQAAK